MLTALTVVTPTYSNRIRGFFAKLSGNKITVKIESARGVALRHIEYENRRGTVDWLRINNLLASARNEILCADNLYLPGEIGFRRFENGAFKIRLACNLGLNLVSRLGEKGLRVGYYDKEGSHTGFVADMLRYTDNLVVVTDYPDAYSEEAVFISEKTGASLRVSDNREALADCNLIISPDAVREILPVSGNAVTLTTSAPEVCIAGLVYYDYHFRMPNMFDRIKPSELSEEYFAGALYTLAGQHELGSIVPTSCSCFSSSQTCASLCDYLSKNI